MTSFYPTSGSVFGGQLVTITGYHFSSDITDNPVRIGYTDCLVQISNDTTIQCLTTATANEVDATEDVIVFL